MPERDANKPATGSGLTTYLNDHLAGSVAAIQLLEHLLGTHSGTDREVLARLRSDIEEDQQPLRELLERLGKKESGMRKAAAWLTEKVGQAKLRFDDPGPGDLRSLEGLEALGLGIQGKLALWRALAAVSGAVPQAAGIDFQRLQQRAVDQFDRVESLRLRAARAALPARPTKGGDKNPP